MFIHFKKNILSFRFGSFREKGRKQKAEGETKCQEQIEKVGRGLRGLGTVLFAEIC
jgi:hypothetical protein